jgi:hypothetical protein
LATLQIRRRLEKNIATLSETIALLRGGQISVHEARRRVRAAEQEWIAIRNLMDKSDRMSRAKKIRPAQPAEWQPFV